MTVDPVPHCRSLNGTFEEVRSPSGCTFANLGEADGVLPRVQPTEIPVEGLGRADCRPESAAEIAVAIPDNAR